jgi:hypothetical protein
VADVEVSREVVTAFVRRRRRASIWLMCASIAFRVTSSSVFASARASAMRFAQQRLHAQDAQVRGWFR